MRSEIFLLAMLALVDAGPVERNHQSIKNRKRFISAQIGGGLGDLGINLEEDFGGNDDTTTSSSPSLSSTPPPSSMSSPTSPSIPNAQVNQIVNNFAFAANPTPTVVQLCINRGSVPDAAAGAVNMPWCSDSPSVPQRTVGSSTYPIVIGGYVGSNAIRTSSASQPSASAVYGENTGIPGSNPRWNNGFGTPPGNGTDFIGGDVCGNGGCTSIQQYCGAVRNIGKHDRVCDNVAINSAGM